jgi:hypothetical protein
VSSAAQVRLEAVGGDRWTWRYVEAGTEIELWSNEMYGSREEAAEWARRAYPDLEVADSQE